jgi:hypothetical protein
MRLSRAVCLVSCGLSIGASNEETFKARLSTVAMDLSMRANVAGTGTVTARLAGNCSSDSRGTGDGRARPGHL